MMPTLDDVAGKAGYIARMLAGLEEIAAEDRQLSMLAYLIGIARAEAEARARAPNG